MTPPLSRDRVGGEADQEEEGRREPEAPSPGREGNLGEGGRRVPRPQEEEHEGPQDPPRPEKPQREEEVRHGARDLLVPDPEERIGDVAAVELAGRKEVQGGDEQPDPPREGHGVQNHVIPLGDGSDDGVGSGPEEDRLSEGNPRLDPGGWPPDRQLEADGEDGGGPGGARGAPAAAP